MWGEIPPPTKVGATTGWVTGQRYNHVNATKYYGISDLHTITLGEGELSLFYCATKNYSQFYGVAA